MFHGNAATGTVGIVDASPHAPIIAGTEATHAPAHVAAALQVLRDALERFGGLELPSVAIRGARPLLSEQGEVVAEESADATGWRTRVSLHVDGDGRVGPYAARSHRVIEVEELPLATAEIQRAARALSAPSGRVDLVQPADGRVRIVPRPEASTPVRAGSGRRGGGPRRGTPPRAGGDAAAHEIITEDVDGRSFRLDAGGFWQVHRLAAHTLTRTVADLLADAKGRIEAVRLLSWRALDAALSGDPAGPELALHAKIFGSETAVAVINDLVQVVGVTAYDTAFPLLRRLHEALAYPVIEGSNVGVRRRQLQAMLAAPGYDPLAASGMS